MEYFDEQNQIVDELIENFKDENIVNQLVLGKTQSGKTSIIKCFIEKILTDNIFSINKEDIYIITGYSSIDWLQQMRERFGQQFHNNIYHQNHLRNRKTLQQFVEKTNYIVFIDENHIACRKHNIRKKTNDIEDNIENSIENSIENTGQQTITKLFETCKWNDIEYCMRNQIKIIQISATPDGTLYDYNMWGEHSKILFYIPPSNYVGSYDLYQQGRIRQYQDLYHSDETYQNEYINDILYTIKTYKTPRYHIIRLKTGSKFQNVYNIFAKKLYYDIECGNVDIPIQLCTFLFEKRNDTIFDINEVFLKNEPHCHIILFIKEKLRCAKTIYKKYIGVCYERISSMDSVIIQGLVGRLNGYDNNNDSICYTNIDTIIRYEKLWNSQWTDTSIEWNSNSTRFVHNETISRGTYSNNPINVIKGSTNKLTDMICITSVHFNEIIQFKEFSTFDEAKKYIKNILKKTSPHNPFNKKQNFNSNGFIETVIYKKKVYTVDEIKKYDTKAIMNKNNGFRLYPCYTDLNNKDTLVFLVCHF